jgi:hypothetical protein
MQKRESKDFNPDLGMLRTKSTFDNGHLYELWVMSYELWLVAFRIKFAFDIHHPTSTGHNWNPSKNIR